MHKNILVDSICAHICICILKINLIYIYIYVCVYMHAKKTYCKGRGHTRKVS